MKRRSFIGTVAAIAGMSGESALATTFIGTNVGMQFPDISYRTQDGQDSSIAKLRGKVALVYLWAVWCPICQNDIYNVRNVYDKLKDTPKFSAIALNFMEAFSPQMNWVRGRGISMPFGDTGIETTRSSSAMVGGSQYPLSRTTPQFYVLDPSGVVAYTIQGKMSGTQQSLDFIQSLLKGVA